MQTATTTVLGQRPTHFDSPMPEDNDSLYQDAINRHLHNVKVQRMGKESSFKQVEKVYGKEASDHVRSKYQSTQTTYTVRQPKVAPVIDLLPSSSGDNSTDSIINRIVDKVVIDMNQRNKYPVDQRWRDGIYNNFLLLRDYVDNNNYGMLREFLEVTNKFWREFYEEYTGIKLPTSDKETLMFLYTNIGKQQY